MMHGARCGRVGAGTSEARDRHLPPGPGAVVGEEQPPGAVAGDGRRADGGLGQGHRAADGATVAKVQPIGAPVRRSQVRPRSADVQTAPAPASQPLPPSTNGGALRRGSAPSGAGRGSSQVSPPSALS